MTEFEFEKCADAVIKLNSSVIGSVSKAECQSETEYELINEFLTDKPVYRIPSSKYKIKLAMTLSGENPFLNEKHFDSLELVLKSYTIKYSGCTVESLKSTVGAKGFVQLEVCASALEREVL